MQYTKIPFKNAEFTNKTNKHQNKTKQKNPNKRSKINKTKHNTKQNKTKIKQSKQQQKTDKGKQGTTKKQTISNTHVVVKPVPGQRHKTAK